MTAVTFPLDILFEDNHLVAVNKPAGVPSAHFDGVEMTVDVMVKEYLKTKYGKPGNVFLGIVHRLDKLTSGVLLFARTSKAAARLSEQFRDHTAVKRYWAIVPTRSIDGVQAPLPSTGTMEDWLVHDDAAEVVRLAKPSEPGAKRARLSYERLATADGRQCFEVILETGRKHQIRVQLASRGFPILGDAKYGSALRLDRFIALHARSLTVQHPITKKPLTITADVPTVWQSRFGNLCPTNSHDTNEQK